MKKIIIPICLSIMVVPAFVFAGCRSNKTKELAKTIENKTTELVYSIETMDDVDFSDLCANGECKTQTYSTTVASDQEMQLVPVSRTTNLKSSNQNRMRGANPKTNPNLKSQSASSTTATAKLATNSSSSNLINDELEIDTNSLGNPNDYSKQLVEKRAQVMLLCSKLRKGDITLSKEDQSKLNEYLNLLNSTTKYLSSTKGSLNKDLAKVEDNSETSATKVALREKIAIRQAKLQTSIFAMDQIINLLDGQKSNVIANNSTTKANSTNTKKTSESSNKTTAKSTSSNGKTTSNTAAKTSNTSKSNTTNTIPNKNTKTQEKVLVPSRTTKFDNTNNGIANNNYNTNATKPKSYTNRQNTNITNQDSTKTDDNAVSILVQPIKTNETNNVQTTHGNSTNYTVRPRTLQNNIATFVAAPISEARPAPIIKIA